MIFTNEESARTRFYHSSAEIDPLPFHFRVSRSLKYIFNDWVLGQNRYSLFKMKNLDQGFEIFSRHTVDMRGKNCVIEKM